MIIMGQPFNLLQIIMIHFSDSFDSNMQIRIELPFEAIVSPSIDVNTMMKTFAIRRTALIWNSR